VTRLKPIAALMALACVALPATSNAADDVATLRAELQALKNDYAARVSELEGRIGQLEAAATKAAPGPDAAQLAGPQTAPAAGAQSAGSAFNPAISVILAGNYTDTSQDPRSWRIAGFMPSGGDVGPGPRSFNLGESELALSASVDPYFSATLIASITAENEIGVEEAYFRTTALPAGFTLKGGRFLSSFGYLNDVHSHAWDFVDQPLIYQAFFGGQMPQDGVQLKWLAPTDLFVELGAETGNGQAFPGTRLDHNGLNGATLFAHLGGDVGDSTSWRTGVSWLEQRSENRYLDDVNASGLPVTDAFTGTSRTWVADATLKWTPNGNVTRQQLKVQAEYMHRSETGQLLFDATGRALSDTYSSAQSGWYVQSVFQFQPRWRIGLRYDSLDSGAPHIGLVDNHVVSALSFPALLAATPDRITLMLDWSPSEFSRLRAQYAWDDARATGPMDRQFRLQYLYSIGAHGAHKF
jgi:hypothetical protein